MEEAGAGYDGRFYYVNPVCFGVVCVKFRVCVYVFVVEGVYVRGGLFYRSVRCFCVSVSVCVCGLCLVGLFLFFWCTGECAFCSEVVLLNAGCCLVKKLVDSYHSGGGW